MKALDSYPQMQAQMMGARAILNDDEWAAWDAMTEAERQAKLADLCASPLHDFSIVYRWYFRAKWTQLMHSCLGERPDVKVVEIGSGESDIVPSAQAVVFPGTEYISVNMNDALSDGLLRKTAQLPLKVTLVRDDAVRIREHLGADSVDMAVFEHSTNDILQAILAERHGVDTVTADWFEVLPDMIRWMREAYLDGTFETALREPFMALMEACFSVVKPGGYLVICHYMFQYDLDLGYHPGLWEGMLQVLRPWVLGLPGSEEVSVEGFDPQWWLVLRKQEG